MKKVICLIIGFTTLFGTSLSACFPLAEAYSDDGSYQINPPPVNKSGQLIQKEKL